MPPKRRWRRIFLLAIGTFGAYLLLCYTLALGIVGHKNAEQGINLPRLRSAPVTVGQYRVPLILTEGLHRFDGRDDRPIFVLVHGYGGSPRTFGRLIEEVHSRDGLVAVPWMRGHGENPTPTVGFGVPESEEVVAVVRYVRAHRPRSKIVVAGVSLGGAAVLLAGPRIREEIEGIAVEASFPTLPEAIDVWTDAGLGRMKGLFGPVLWMAERMVGENPSSVRPEDAARTLRGLPGVIIRCGEDELMPSRFSDRLSTASGWPIFEVPQARHAAASRQDPKGYADQLYGLIRP